MLEKSLILLYCECLKLLPEEQVPRGLVPFSAATLPSLSLNLVRSELNIINSSTSADVTPVQLTLEYSLRLLH